jgi:8-oxo-dGTP diphosphatase
MSYAYQYPHFALAVDVVMFRMAPGPHPTLEVLLIQRGMDPFAGSWALPGGFLRPDDVSMDAAARRELSEETGIHDVFLEQLGTYGDVGRDPRERVISCTYWALVPHQDMMLRSTGDARSASWVSMRSVQGMSLAFDHAHILRDGLERLRGKTRYSPLPIHLVREPFTINHVATAYEVILEKRVDRGNLLRRLVERGLIIPCPHRVRLARGRPAMLYTWNHQAWAQQAQEGSWFTM